MSAFWNQKAADIRKHAKGADIALLNDSDHFTAIGPDAVRARKAAGTLGQWIDLDGSGQITFPTAAMMHVLTVLSQRHSVALIERLVQPTGTFGPPFVAVWIVPRSALYEADPIEDQPAENFNDLLD